MRRRELLVCGSALLSAGLSGCLGSLRSAGDGTEQMTESTTLTTTTTKPGKEALRILNDDSTTYEIDLVVHSVGDAQNPVVDSTFEVPGKYLLYFPPFLEHGQPYNLKATLAQGTTLEATITNDGCANDQYNPEGSMPLVLGIYDGKLDIPFWACDVVYPTDEYTGSMAHQHEISNATTEMTTTETIATTTDS